VSEDGRVHRVSHSLRRAINAFCKSCIYDPEGGVGNWRQQVTDCPSKTCPLYRVRPQTKPHKSGSKGANLVPPVGSE
jgi:hypothetical protein